MNPRMTKRELGLLKGAINRVFPRSELYRQAMDKLRTLTHYVDPKRPRVKTWKFCPTCNTPQAKSDFQVDHISPRVPIGQSFDQMTLDEYIDRTWCDLSNLQPCCKSCHKLKSKAEMKERKQHKTLRKFFKVV